MGLVRLSPLSSPILVDASFLVAIYDRSDFHHSQCMRALEEVVEPLVTCEAVVTEAIHLLRGVPGAAESILVSIQKRELEIHFGIVDSAGEVLNLYGKYRDTHADFADACLIHMADQLGTSDILTLDSDFKHYRWRRNRTFRMLIPLEK